MKKRWYDFNEGGWKMFPDIMRRESQTFCLPSSAREWADAVSGISALNDGTGANDRSLSSPAVIDIVCKRLVVKYYFIFNKFFYMNLHLCYLKLNFADMSAGSTIVQYILVRGDLLLKEG